MFERKWLYLTSFISTTTNQPEPVDQFQRTFFEQILQVSVFLCTSRPKFENVAPEELRVQNNTFCVNCLVLVSRKRSLVSKSDQKVQIN